MLAEVDITNHVMYQCTMYQDQCPSFNEVIYKRYHYQNDYIYTEITLIVTILYIACVGNKDNEGKQKGIIMHPTPAIN